MKTVIYVSTIISICILTGSLSAKKNEKETIKRLAIIIGANNGGPSRVRLRYARSDARSVYSVLTKLGGVTPKDVELLYGPSRNKIFSTLRTFYKKAIQARKKHRRVEFIFYYSGHSDEEGILIRGQKIQYKQIRKKITRIPAQVHIAILDSCSSGAFTLTKGGKMRSPFLMDQSYDMKGYAFMSSSAQDEVSQESDRIKGSFFTHYLVAGLRGAADMSRDGRVTLNEAYQFAYNETLGHTEQTLSGPQHPNYNIQMSGTGDVIMTEIRRSSSILVLNSNIEGKLFIRDYNNNLVMEIKKPYGKKMQLGLEHGSYTILNQRNNNIYQKKINLINNRGLLISANTFTRLSKEETVARGGIPQDNRYIKKPFSFIFIPSFDREEKTTQTFSFHIIANSCSRLEGFNFGIGPSIVYEEVNGTQISIGNYAGGDMAYLQIGWLFNIVRNNANGVQISPIFNTVSNLTTGVQLSALFNYTGALNGVQISSLFNISGGKTDGVQIAPLFNHSADKVDGVQISAFHNNAADLDGVQVSLLNVADHVDGVQVGLINVSDDNEGIAIGLLNLSKNGAGGIDTYTSNLTGLNIGFKFRVGYTYTMFSVGGANNIQNTDLNESIAIGFHLGGHIPVNSFYINGDIGFINILNDNRNRNEQIPDKQVLEGRLLTGYYINKYVSVFGGAGLDYIVSMDTRFDSGRFRPHYLIGTSFYFYHGDYGKQ